MARSTVDSAIDTAMGTLTETHGVLVTYYFAETPDTPFEIRGIFDRVGIVRRIVDGMPTESKATTIGFRKSDFENAGHRQPRNGDKVDVPDNGLWIVHEIGDDDGIESICTLRGDNPNA